MNCDSVLERIAAGDGGSGRNRQEIEAHLGVCADCRARESAAKALGRQLRDPLVWEEPPADLAQRVVDGVAGESVPQPSRLPRWLAAGAVAMAALVFGFGWLTGRPDWSVELVPGSDAPPTAHAAVSGWNRGEGTRMSFAVTGLDEAPEGHYYEVWLTAADGRHVSAGTFNGPGTFEVMAGVRRGAFPRIWVTLEPADDDLTPFPLTMLDTAPGDGSPP